MVDEITFRPVASDSWDDFEKLFESWGGPKSGTVTLSNDERHKSPGTFCSCRANRLIPCCHSRSPESAVRFSRNEVALDVESVAGGSMNREKSLG